MKKRQRKRWSSVILFGLPSLGGIALLTSCASMTLEEKYALLDPVERNAFLANYLKANSVAAPSRNPGRTPSSETPPPAAAEKLAATPEYSQDPILKRVRILTRPDGPDYDGSPLKLRAILDYADGRQADATHDVKWEIQPALGEIAPDSDDPQNEPRLNFACAATDLVLGADFFGESVGKKAIHVRKPLSRLELKLNDPSAGADEGGSLRLQLVAYCKDGTVSDVTCLADWWSEASDIEVRGCGILRLKNSAAMETFRRRPLDIQAAYGGMEVRQQFHLPFRP